MKIHLIRDTYLQEEIYNEIVSFLKDSNGLMEFKNCDQEFEIVNSKFQQSYWDVCNSYREEKKLKGNEIVVFLSSTSYDNFFSLPDFKNNIYVKTRGWENFVDSQIRFPIVIEIVTNIFHLLLFDSLEGLQQKTHMNDDKGCLNDYTLRLTNVRLKMKTPDLCDDCMELLKPEFISPNIVEQIFKIADKASVEMRKVKRYINAFVSVDLHLKKYQTKLYFKDPLNHTLRIPPIPFTLYKYLLLHPDGVVAQNIFSIKEELFEIYYKGKISKNTEKKSINSIENLCYKTSESVSTINALISKSLPSSIAEQYKIQNIKGRYIITLDRDLVKGI